VLIGQYNVSNNSFALGGLLGGIGQIFNENKTSAVGSAFSEVILNNFGANSFSASGLPAGLSLNPTTGLITGTFAAGTFTITASNSLTRASASKTLTYTASLQPPVITGIVPKSATFGSPATITIQINNGATAVSVSGLPGGLTHAGGASLIISGTPTVAGTFNLVITASNAAGSDTQTIPLTVQPGAAPAISYAGTLNDAGTIVATQNRAYSNSTDPNLHLYRFVTDLDADPIRKPVSYTLPGNVASDLNNIGLFLNPTNGVLFGTPITRTNLTLPVTIANAAIGATRNFILNVKYAAPQLASTTATATVGKPINIPLVFTEQSRVTSLQLTTVPPLLQGKVVLNANQLTNATLSGSYSGAPISEQLVLTAGNEDATNSNLRFTLVLEADTGKPNLSSATTVAGKVGQTLSFQLTADNSPTSFAASGLPAGLSLNTATGLVSGVPTEEGTFAVSFSAANGNGTGPAQTVSFTIDLDPPSITSSSVAVGTVRSSFSFQVTASPNPTAFQISNGTLPTGLTLAQDTGVISGTPTVSGNFVVQVQARNSKGLGVASSLTFSIAGIPPVITSALTATGNAEQPFSYQITANNGPFTSFAASGLPAGLSINTATGVISGTPGATFSGDVTITASNSAGGDSRTLRLVINPVIVIITTTNVTGSVGTPLSFQLAANPANDVFFSEGTQKLPKGVTINLGGLIQGIPLSAGSTAVNLKTERLGQVTEDSRYTKVNFSFTNPAFLVEDPDGDGVLTFTAGAPGRFTLSAPAGFNLSSVEAEGLPDGLRWDGTAVAGTPTTGTRTSATNSIKFTATLTTDRGTATLSTNLLVRVNATPASLELPEEIEVEVGKRTAIPITFGGTDTLVTAAGLPPGLILSGGVLSGTNTSTNGPAGWKATITSDNSGLTGGTNISRAVTIRLRNPVPVMTGISRIITSQGRSARLNLTFDATVENLRLRNLPSGVEISGNQLTVPASLAPGKYTLQVESENRLRPGDPTSLLQTALADVRIFVDQGPPPAATLAAIPSNLTLTAGSLTEQTLIQPDSGVRVAALGLPAGLTLDPESGKLSGTASRRGTYLLTLFVQNGKRWVKKSVTLKVK
jgi:hypothetical protein